MSGGDTWGSVLLSGLRGYVGTGPAYAAEPHVEYGPDASVGPYSTVTDLARLRGLSMSLPRCNAVW